MPQLHVVVLATAGCVFAAGADFPTASEQELLAHYQQLRGVALDASRSFLLENVSLDTGSGTFRFKEGSLHLLEAVGGRAPGAVFLGDGGFSLKPPDELERNQLRRFTGGQTEVEEPFKELVLFATDRTLAGLTAGLEPRTGAVSPRAADILADFRKLARETLRSNIEARLLAGFCSPRERLVLADIRGQKRGRFLFLIDSQSEDEVQLLRSAPRDSFDLWTAFHLPGDPGVAQRALVDTVNTKMEIDLDKKGRLSGSAEIEFTSLAAGARVLNVRLASALRVSKVTASGGAELKFIQEDKKKDGDLWIIAPKPLAKGEQCVWKIEYAGEDVVRSEGNGNFYVGRRTSWFPKLDVPGDPFTDRAIYRLRFQSPKEFTLVATGKLVKRSTEGKVAVSEWDTEIPYPVIGFNYGKFKARSAAEGGAEITVYANEGLNDELQQMQMIAGEREAAKLLGISGSISTTGMAEAALAEARNSMRVYTHMFGPLPFPTLSISQQPSSSFGQSWPTLVFMPYTAFLDPTVRNQWGIGRDKGTRQFLEEVGPHEVAHQWWGHLVGTKTYHDEWLSEGFADYSAGLYLHVIRGDAKFRGYIEAQKEAITEPLRDSTMRAYEAGPIWLGRRLSTDKNPDAYVRLVYAKGAYVLHMLRMMLYNFAAHDDSRFIAMMRDFTATYGGRDASTEDFKAIVDKHFRADMSWFFNQWVYGSEFPKLSVQYNVVPNEKGAVLQGTIRQSGVSKGFRTILPFMAFMGKSAASGKVLAEGETSQFSVPLPAMAERVEFNPLGGALCELEVKKM